MSEEKTYRSSAGDFHYFDWGGTGPLAHFSHATGFCAGMYSPLAERLLSHLRMVGMDDRGHGKTRAVTDLNKLKNWDIFAQDLERFFEHLNEPVIAMGHSRGAASSLLLTIRRPDLVRALVLVDPTILPLKWKWMWFTAQKLGLTGLAPIVSRAAKRRNPWPDRETIINAYRDFGPFRNWKDGFLEGYINHGTEKTDDGTVRLCCDPAWESKSFSSCPPSVWKELTGLKRPTLVIYGADSDTFLAPAAKRFKAIVPNAVMRRFDDTSHFVPMERPDETSQAIIGFLKDNKII